MVLFNYSTKELTAKVVYYGPGLCGKTTNLQWVHEKLPIKNKGKMLSLATETDRTLFFDFLPIEIGTIRGMKTRIQLYTVPGQVFYNATRRMVLKGADAVCFVCDSQEAMLDANLESYENMRQNLEANEIDADEIPVVLQYNKRDLPNALPIEILNERMNPHNYPFYEAIAVKGVGVEDTLKAVTKLVFKALSVRYGDGAAAPSAPGRAPGPPRSIPPLPPTPAPPLAVSTDDLLGELDLGMPEPEEVAAPAPSLPPIEFDENTPVGSVYSEPDMGRRGASPRRLPPRGPPRWPRLTPARRRSPLAPRSRRTARRTRSSPARTRPTTCAGASPRPGCPWRTSRWTSRRSTTSTTRPTPSSCRGASRTPRRPSPCSSPRGAGATEVEVPIDIEVAPGTTRISLNIKLLLSLRRR